MSSTPGRKSGHSGMAGEECHKMEPFQGLFNRVFEDSFGKNLAKKTKVHLKVL
jgi:hypothetical protein